MAEDWADALGECPAVRTKPAPIVPVNRWRRLNMWASSKERMSGMD
jgi:hypothetical protein